jgi:hypothetical protein
VFRHSAGNSGCIARLVVAPANAFKDRLQNLLPRCDTRAFLLGQPLSVKCVTDLPKSLGDAQAVEVFFESLLYGRGDYLS